MTIDLIGGAITKRKLEDCCSSGLWKLLTASGDTRGSCMVISRNQALRTELQAVAEDMRAMGKPMEWSVLFEKLVALAPEFGLEHLGTKIDAEMFFKSYREALEDLPPEAFDEGIRRWKAGDFFKKESEKIGAVMYPRAEQIRVLAEPTTGRVLTILWRLKQALAECDRVGAPQTARPTRDDLIAAGVLDANGRAILPKKQGAPVLDDLMDQGEAL